MRENNFILAVSNRGKTKIIAEVMQNLKPVAPLRTPRLVSYLIKFFRIPEPYRKGYPISEPYRKDYSSVHIKSTFPIKAYPCGDPLNLRWVV